jgi:VWFA-related protein
MRVKHTTRRRLLAAIWAASLVTGPLWAQNPQSQTPPVNPRQGPAPPAARPAGAKGTIRTAVDLVEIDALVTDRDGKPIKGLTKEQFSLTENGRPQTISTFEYNDVEKIETAAAAGQPPITIPLGTVAALEQVKAQVRDRRLIVFFFDMTSLEPEDQLRSTRAAEKFLRERMTPADLVGVVAFGNTLQVIANLTNDRALLLDAVKSLVPGHEAELAAMVAAAAQDGETAVTEDTGSAFTADDTEFNVFNTDRKLAAMEAVSNILDGIPGKKAVIQFTGGITQTGEENRSQLTAATNAANRANVSIYTVDSRGLLAEIPGGDASVGAASGRAMYTGAAVFQQTQARQDSRETLATLAADTGGRSFFDVGDFNKIFEAVQEDTSGYYLLGYYSTDTARDGRWRRVNVKIKLPPGAHLRYREGYYAPKNFSIFTTEDRERQLEEAMNSPTPEVELPIAVETAQFRIDRDQIFVPIAAKLAPSALQWAEKRGSRETAFDFAAEVRDARTRRVVGALRDTVTVKLDAQRFEQILQRALVYQGGVLLAPGTYQLKFLARENESGRIGTFEEQLTLPPPQPAQLQLSSVLLSSQVEQVQKTSEVKMQALAADAKMKSSPLEIGNERIIPSVTRVFTDEQTMYVFFQAYLPQKADPAALRAGLIFFRNGERVSDTPLVSPAEYDAKTRTASFRIRLPIGRVGIGRYTVQAVVIDAGTPYAAFARNYFAVRPAPKPASAAQPASR